MNFTQDEMNMLCIYNGGSREKTIAELQEMRGYLEPDETELTDSTIAKLEKISDAEFDKLDLIPDFLEEWEDMNAG